MSDRGLNALSQMIKEIRGARLTPGMFRRTSHQEGDLVISVVGSLDLPTHMLYRSTQIRTEIEKYRRKVQKSIGLGIMVRDKSKPFESAVWIEGPWKFDQEMEKIIESEPPFVIAPGQRIPGRNQPCTCGSGKKFKKCCWPKIEAAYRKK